jgi:hypothetical protein
VHLRGGRQLHGRGSILVGVGALTNDALVHEASAIVGGQSPSALAYATGALAPAARG